MPLLTNVITSSLYTPVGATRTAHPATITSSFSSWRTFVSSSSTGRVTATSPSSASPTAQAESSGSSSGSNQSLKVGLGVGISLGVVMLALAAYLGTVLYDKRAARKQVSCKHSDLHT